MTREALLVHTMVELADSLVDDFDIVDLLATLAERCVDVLDVAAVGIMLAAPDGELLAMTSSDETMRTVELFELQSREGPCLDCYRSGQPVVNQDLTRLDGRWAALRPVRRRGRLPRRRCHPDASARPGHRGAQPVPRPDRVVGSCRRDGRPGLADVATIAILQHRHAAGTAAVNDQLQNALDSRVLIRAGQGDAHRAEAVPVGDAFVLLRAHARNHKPPAHRRRPRHHRNTSTIPAATRPAR